MEKLELYENYIRDTEKKFEVTDPIPKEKIKEIVRFFNNEPLVEWVDITDGDEPIGFFIVGREKYATDIDPDGDYNIGQIYVLPEYRRQGLAQKSLIHFIEQFKGKYCLALLENNTEGQKFLKSLVEFLGTKLDKKDYEGRMNLAEKMVAYTFEVL